MAKDTIQKDPMVDYISKEFQRYESHWKEHMEEMKESKTIWTPALNHEWERIKLWNNDDFFKKAFGLALIFNLLHNLQVGKRRIGEPLN